MAKEKTDLVWLAGFIDGDGSISLGESTRRKITGSQQYFDDLLYDIVYVHTGQVVINQKLVGVLRNILQMVEAYDLPLPNIVGPSLAVSTTMLWFSTQKGVQLLEKVATYFRHPRYIIKAPLYVKLFKSKGSERKREVYEFWLEAKAHGYEDAPVPGWPEDEDLPYLAGFFEAEGCISISQANTKYFNVVGQVHITQKSIVMLERIAEIVGRQGIPVPRLSTDHIYFSFNGYKGKALLEKLLPFMRHPEKIVQAKFYIKFFSVPPVERQQLFKEEWLDLRASGRLKIKTSHTENLFEPF